ncbi:uncharacterized protein LODBEIA_P25570 [Lodderomyces beijingensis]|uniref:MHD domain-containing protein n=1 Tax=Lodderomyces beijingensis TaxID=1775926 RepID=A0ABP0ZJL0_9ASCO
MITAVFLYDSKGDILISKVYKDDIKRSIADVFRIQVINQVSSGRASREHRTPVLTLGSTSFIYIKSGNVWICAVTRSNQDCAAVLEFLYKLEALLCTVLWDDLKKSPTKSDKPALTDASVVNHFPLCYDILTEVCDYGYPINLDLEYVKKYTMGTKSSDMNIFKRVQAKRTASSSKVNVSPVPNNENVTWRSENIKYRRNEIFVNVEERINVLMNAQSEILRSYVAGSIQMKTRLSGMPHCRFGFNPNTVLLSSSQVEYDQRDRLVVLEDTKFHQCVELSAFDHDRSIQFIPPDGEFQMMSYIVNQDVNIPFKVFPSVQEIGNRVIYKIRMRSLYPSKNSATGIKISIPVPICVGTPEFFTTGGKAKFEIQENCIVWKFNKISGDQEYAFNAEVTVDPTSEVFAQWNRPPITMDFEIDTYSSSALTVRYLKVQERGNYKSVKWVRYKTKAGSYEIRY